MSVVHNTGPCGAARGGYPTYRKKKTWYVRLSPELACVGVITLWCCALCVLCIGHGWLTWWLAMVCVWQVLRQREGVDVKRDAVLYPPGWALEDLASDNDVIPAEFLSKQPSSPIPSISA